MNMFATCWDYLYMGLVGVSFFGTCWDHLENFLLELLRLSSLKLKGNIFMGLVGVSFLWDLLGSISKGLLENFLLELLRLYFL